MFIYAIPAEHLFFCSVLCTRVSLEWDLSKEII